MKKLVGIGRVIVFCVRLAVVIVVTLAGGANLVTGYSAAVTT